MCLLHIQSVRIELFVFQLDYAKTGPEVQTSTPNHLNPLFKNPLNGTLF